MISCQQRGVGQTAKATQGQGDLWVPQAREWCQLGLGLQHHGQRLSHCQDATVMGQQRPPPAMLLRLFCPSKAVPRGDHKDIPRGSTAGILSPRGMLP